MKTEVKNIASIQTGLFIKPIGSGDVVYLQAKHFDENGLLKATLHADLKADNIISRHMLKHGDVLFSAKGTKNFAAVFESHNPTSVASTSFFVIRLSDKNILPEYLAWFLNNPTTQKLLKEQAIGTSIPSISKAVLEELEISIPSLEKQNAILTIAHLRNTEKDLKHQIEVLREKQIQQTIINALK
ncbi:MAG: restriction endonuclease subunit S [Cytophagales bacterium]